MDTKTETTAPAPAPVKEAEDKAAMAKTAAVDDLVEKWIAGLRDGAIANHTPAWNALTASLPGLKAAIIKNGG